MNENYFARLNSIDVGDKIEQKGRLNYLSWAYAWGEVKKVHPDATYTVYETPDGKIYHTDGKTCWVKTGVTVNGIEHIEYLPILDGRNQSIKLEHVTSYDVNKAIQRSITKACARHGLGLYIYAGEDLPEGEEPEAPPKQDKPPKKQPEPPRKVEQQDKPAQRMAAKGQKMFIIENLPEKQLDRLVAKYGPDLDGFTFEDAEKTIAAIQKGMNGNG